MVDVSRVRAKLPERNCRSRGHVERIHTMSHGDAHGHVTARDGPAAKPGTLSSHKERKAVDFGKSGIVKRLNELGIPNPAAYKRKKGFKFCNPQIQKNDGLWNEKTVRDILLNQMYIGNMEPMRVHGTWKTVPIDTRTALR